MLESLYSVSSIMMKHNLIRSSMCTLVKQSRDLMELHLIGCGFKTVNVRVSIPIRSFSDSDLFEKCERNQTRYAMLVILICRNDSAGPLTIWRSTSPIRIVSNRFWRNAEAGFLHVPRRPKSADLAVLPVPRDSAASNWQSIFAPESS